MTCNPNNLVGNSLSAVLGAGMFYFFAAAFFIHTIKPHY